MNYMKFNKYSLLVISIIVLAGCAPAKTEKVNFIDGDTFAPILSEQGFSSEELVLKALARIDNIDKGGPNLQSVLSINPKALEIAQKLDAKVEEGYKYSPLYGKPILIKDNVETKDDLPTTGGSWALINNKNNRDSPIVKKLRDSGAVILGKTNLSQWANFRSESSTSGWSAVRGQVKNPHVLNRSPCGSSSGSGSAVASGIVAAAIGTETNGDINVSDTSGNKIAKFQQNQDISFYEDTGTTAKFFWDASAEALAVGGTNTFTSKIVASAANGTAYTSNSQLRISGGGTNNNRASIVFSDDALSDGKISYYPHVTEASRLLSLSARTTESDFVITGAGNVGINNSSPVEMLTIGSTSDTNVRAQFLSSTTGANTIQFGDGTGASAYSGYINYTHSDNALVFATSSTERMRISSAGHTMFATTDDAPGAGNTQSGVAIRGGSDNRSFFSASSNYAMHLNRNTNDGEILYFAKNGTAVGSIGTNAATMYVSAPQAGGMKYSYYNSTNAVMLPVTTTGANADATHDLGYGSSRFRDLYLSGGVYLGGTGAASKLDDYEEGNWAPSIGAGITAVGTVTTSGTYTKVGRIVTLQFTLSATTSLTVTGVNNVLCGTLPFQMAGNHSMSFMLLNSAFGEAKPQSGWSYNLYGSTAMAATPNLYATLTYVTN